MFQDGLLKGKNILITGGGTGLGREIAAKYLQLGADLWIAGRRQGVLEATAKELTAQHGGRVIKYAADNMIASFPATDAAASAALAINRAIATGAEGFTVSIGIDFGRFLLIEEGDCYGDPVNVACKLGEDIADSGEVLLTAAARSRLDPGFPHALREQVVSVSGLEIHVFAVQ